MTGSSPSQPHHSHLLHLHRHARLSPTFGAVPYGTFWWRLLQAHTLEMEPLIRTLVILTANHIPIAHRMTETIFLRVFSLHVYICICVRFFHFIINNVHILLICVSGSSTPSRPST